MRRYSLMITISRNNFAQNKLNTARLACVASVPVRAKCYVSRGSEDSGCAKIGAVKKEEKEGEGDQNLCSRATHSTSLARERLLHRLQRVHVTFWPRAQGDKFKAKLVRSLNE